MSNKDLLNNKIICIMGKSGSGKSTLIGRLCEEYPEMFHYVKSYTTRDVRPNDPEDINTHTFVKESDWDKNKDNAWVAYLAPQGYVSWTDETCFDKDKINIYAIDPMAAEELHSEYGNEWDVYGVYLYVDEKEREKRYSSRERLGTRRSFSKENHIDEKYLSDLYYEKIDISKTNKEEAFTEFKYAVELVGGIKL